MKKISFVGSLFLNLKIGDFLKTKKKAIEEIFISPLPPSLIRPNN